VNEYVLEEKVNEYVLEVGDGEGSSQVKGRSVLTRRTSPTNSDDVGAIGEKMMQHHV
jgi:hypothetical protein